MSEPPLPYSILIILIIFLFIIFYRRRGRHSTRGARLLAQLRFTVEYSQEITDITRAYNL